MPKAKSKTTKEPKDTEGEPKLKEKMSKEELWEERLRLQKAVDEKRREEEEYYKTEMELAQKWDACKRELEEIEAGNREKRRVIVEMKKRHQEEIREWEEKIRNTEAAHANEIAELKMAAFTKQSKFTVGHVTSEFEQLKLEADQRRKEATAKALICEFKKKHQKELQELNESYEQKARDTESYYANKIASMAEESREKTEAELDEINAKNIKLLASTEEEYRKKLADFLQNRKEMKLERNKLQMKFERLKIGGEVPDSTLEMQKMRENLQHLKERRQRLPYKLKKELSGQILDKGLVVLEKSLDLMEVQRKIDDIWIDDYNSCLTGQERKPAASVGCDEKELLNAWLVLALGKEDITAAKNIRKLIKHKRRTVNALKRDVSQHLKEYDELAKRSMAEGKPVRLWLPMRDIEKFLKKAPNKKMLRELKEVEDIIQKEKEKRESILRH